MTGSTPEPATDDHSATRPPPLTTYQVLALPMEDNEAEATTIGDYLTKLLAVMWDSRDNFNPFGNSGWSHDLYVPLVQAGLIAGTVDDDGYVDVTDRAAGATLIAEAIEAMVPAPTRTATAAACADGGVA